MQPEEELALLEPRCTVLFALQQDDITSYNSMICHPDSDSNYLQPQDEKMMPDMEKAKLAPAKKRAAIAAEAPASATEIEVPDIPKSAAVLKLLGGRLSLSTCTYLVSLKLFNICPLCMPFACEAALGGYVRCSAPSISGCYLVVDNYNKAMNLIGRCRAGNRGEPAL